MKFGIIGYGIIGRATELALLKNQDIVIHDTKLGTKLEDLATCDIVFICIPTNNESDILIIETIIDQLKNNNANVKIILRSTVTVGTCKQLNDKFDQRVYYMPEFLRERFWDSDCFAYPILVGSGINLNMLETRTPIVYSDNATLEILKMFSNNLNSLKIVFANHFYDLAQSADVDYSSMIKLYSLIQNNQSYLEVNENLRGFGGKCLPKDIDFIIKTFLDYNIDQQLFTAVREDNQKWPIHVRKY